MKVEIENSAEVVTSLRKALVAMKRYNVFAYQDDVVVVEGLIQDIEETIEKEAAGPECECGHTQNEHYSPYYGAPIICTVLVQKPDELYCHCSEFKAKSE